MLYKIHVPHIFAYKLEIWELKKYISRKGFILYKGNQVSGL